MGLYYQLLQLVVIVGLATRVVDTEQVQVVFYLYSYSSGGGNIMIHDYLMLQVATVLFSNHQIVENVSS